MKREYIGMLFFITFVGLIFILEYFFGEKVVMDNLSRYIVVWIVLGFTVGQYSMKFPKAF
jgi:hypothetical protein